MTPWPSLWRLALTSGWRWKRTAKWSPRRTGRLSPCAGTNRSSPSSRHSDGHGVMLVLPSKEVWTFDAYEERVELEESVYLAGPDGPRRSVQIVIYGQARAVPREIDSSEEPT